jgi:hypothetical protein
MSEDQLVQVQELIDSASASLKTARNILSELTGVQDATRQRYASKASEYAVTPMRSGGTSGKIIEGVFDGQNMVDSGGQTYPVPANYASKSKLVEGDRMKLTITDEGKFIYKQIAPIDRKTIVGVLIQEDGQYKVIADGKTYRVLLASVTFYRAEVGDQVTIILPTEGDALWGAIEAVIPRHVTEEAARAHFESETADDGEMMPTVE